MKSHTCLPYLYELLLFTLLEHLSHNFQNNMSLQVGIVFKACMDPVGTNGVLMVKKLKIFCQETQTFLFQTFKAVMHI